MEKEPITIDQIDVLNNTYALSLEPETAERLAYLEAQIEACKARDERFQTNHPDHIFLGRLVQNRLKAQTELKLEKPDNPARIDFLERVKETGFTARQIFITTNLGLVHTAVQDKYQYAKSLSYDDLFQEGSDGLIVAVEKFNPEMGFAFSTYADHWIKQRINRALSKDNPINQSAGINAQYLRFNRALRSLEQSLNRQPNLEELAEVTGFNLKQIQQLSEIKRTQIHLVSLDTPNYSHTNDASDDSLYSMLTDSSQALPENLTISHLDELHLLQTMEEVLTAREQRIIKMRFGMEEHTEQTLEAIGKKYGYTRERIRQIEAVALKKLRNSLQIQALKFDYN